MIGPLFVSAYTVVSLTWCEESVWCQINSLKYLPSDEGSSIFNRFDEGPSSIID